MDEDTFNMSVRKFLKKVGVTAGASTPNWLIDQVVERLREIAE